MCLGSSISLKIPTQQESIPKAITLPDHSKNRQIRRPAREENAENILAFAIVEPRLSLRRRERESGVSRSTIPRLPSFPSLLQRVQFCNWIEQPPHNFQRKILFTDECTFHSHETINTWNNRHWADQNPHWLEVIDAQHQRKVNVRCGIVNKRIIGPYFIEGNLNAVSYTNFLVNNLPELLEYLPLRERRNNFFQQHGCPAHTSRLARNCLNEMFPRRWIGKYGPINWPPRSPDLTVLDYYLWGNMGMYSERPTTDKRI